MSKETIAFIGTGVMGRSMAMNLLGAGYGLRVYSRTRSKADDLVEKGAVWADTPKEAARGADVAITIVGYPQDVESVYLGSDGLIDGLGEGALAIEMTTSSPALAEKIAKAAFEKGIDVLDAPVSGGDLGAREARLSIMVGGRKEAFDRAAGILEAMGKTIVYQGAAGAGQHTKMCNQIAIASGMVSIAESLEYAKAAGLDARTVLKSIESGAAGSWSLTNLVPRALDGDFAPGFFVKHFIKDVGIALESAKSMGLTLDGLAHAKRVYEALAEAGFGDEGTQVAFRCAME